MGSRRKQAEKEQQEDVLPISVWDAPSDSRLHHWPRRTHYHSHRDNCQCGQILKVCQRGGLRGQGRLHRPDHQVLRLRRLLWHPLLHPPLHGSKDEASLLLIFWIVITLCCSVKYLYDAIVSDWTSLEDWVSISYLAFY